MKNLLFLLLALGIATQSFAGKPKTATLQVSYVFKNIVEGYDHSSIGKLFIDDKKVYESPEHLESKKQNFTVTVDKGEHEVRLEIWNLYEGVWELHSVDNNYSIDAFIEDDLTIKKSKHTLDVVFDIDSEMSYKFK